MLDIFGQYIYNRVIQQWSLLGFYTIIFEAKFGGYYYL